MHEIDLFNLSERSDMIQSGWSLRCVCIIINGCVHVIHIAENVMLFNVNVIHLGYRPKKKATP